jgi:hypothetical protein
MNFITGGLLLVINVIGLAGASASNAPADIQNAAGGLLFAFTYILLGLYLSFNKDFFNIGLYGGFAALIAVFFASFAFIAGDWFMGALWCLWCVLWAEMTAENVFKAKLGLFPPVFLIAEGLTAALAPAVYLLFF